ncbi:hypothetical protein BH10BAC6_BH10BAC6_16000 [soil metagenome]
MKARFILVLTSDLNVMSTVGSHSHGATSHVRCVPTQSALIAYLSEHDVDELCVILDEESEDVVALQETIRSRTTNAVLIALVDHPYPDIVQHKRLQGITHVIKRDSLPELLASITKEIA